MQDVIIMEVDIYRDERGWLAEIFREDQSDFRPAMSYLSVTKPGVTRGPHEHVEQSDYFCFIGNFMVYLWDNRKGSDTYKEKKIIDTKGKPYIVIVPPGVVHAYKNTGLEDAIVINMPDRLYKGKGKAYPVDENRHEDDADSPFRLEE